MKGSNETSARPTAAQRTGRSSGRPTPTLTSGDSFSLSGPSNPPDPDFNAYRQDLADVALAAQVIASHYAEPLERAIANATELRSAPAEDAEVIRMLAPGEAFAMLDDTLGWAWGYAGDDHRVGYVKSGAVGP
ncbi:MAG TPA: hypothetical protein VFQ33_10930 [Xanthobacteraceae bacterium]|nr:hypothetical protein [Xanthobacteraceae bacterium]